MNIPDSRRHIKKGTAPDADLAYMRGATFSSGRIMPERLWTAGYYDCGCVCPCKRHWFTWTVYARHMAESHEGMPVATDPRSISKRIRQGLERDE